MACGTKVSGTEGGWGGATGHMGGCCGVPRKGHSALCSVGPCWGRAGGSDGEARSLAELLGMGFCWFPHQLVGG